MKKYFLVAFASIIASGFASSQKVNADSVWVMNNYYKIERSIPMRDGVKLFTSMYVPKDTMHKHPMLMNRTPYSCQPYGEAKFRKVWYSPYMAYFKEGYIMITQDVRGKYMSEGTFVDVRPFIKDKKTNSDIDEASDTYDAIDWLVKNAPHNNGNVGMFGISYPGFYATMGALCGHPALKAVSPQAPVTDWFMGDDTHHKGVLFIMDEFDFDLPFGMPRHGPTTTDADVQEVAGDDNYQLYLNMGTYAEISKKYGGDSIGFWKELVNHPDYDNWWKDRDPRRVLENVKPAIMVTGGLFDAEDLYGTFGTYKAIKKLSPATNCKIVEGPWFHGGWARSGGDRLGNVYFGSRTSDYYMKNIEVPFFNYYLKGEGDVSKQADATVFVTGEDNWHTFAQWPPQTVVPTDLYFHANGKLSFEKPSTAEIADTYISDPMKPVPYTETVHRDRTREYMCDDQRFASRRTDVLTYETDTLRNDMTLTGPVVADLLTSITTTDADFVVKVIDVFPDNFKYPDSLKMEYPMGGYQMLVRAEIMRGRYRNSFEKPEAFVPGKISEVKYELPDVAHTFLKGHRIMIQIQSTWFPLADRNPQQFINPYTSLTKDFVKSTISIYHNAVNASKVVLPVLK